MKNFFVCNLLVTILMLSACKDDPIEMGGQGKLTGKVVEDLTFLPVENAKITVSSINTTGFSDAEGNFVFEEVSVGDYSVSAKKDGFVTQFEPATVTINSTTNVVFELLVETALNSPPSTPTLLSPENLSDLLDLEVLFSWQSSDPEEDSILYRLEVGNDRNNEIIEIKDLTDTIYTINNLFFGTKYFWQVGVSDGVNAEVLSSVFSFTTKPVPFNRLLFVKNENLLSGVFSAVIDENNELVDEFKVSLDGENSWRPRKNPVNNTLAYLSFVNNTAHIFIMNTDGSNKRQVTSEKPIVGFDYNELDFSWSPDGGSLIYPNYDKLYKINSNGTELELLYSTDNGNFISECTWNASLDKIAIKTNDFNGYQVEIYTIDLSGSIIDVVLTGVAGAAGGLDFSVQGDKLIYTYDISGFENASYRQLDSHVFLYDLNTKISIDLSENKPSGTNDLDPRFSADGSGIIFVNASNDGVSDNYIYTSKLNANSRTLIISKASMPDWE
ncbi:MAG: hypothetical protein COB81_11275 [Flavobacteriaceae bacterium]|nr:MAG: hypothetical protein COB81_11275 [Flavobacteriaceae bacterium]